MPALKTAVSGKKKLLVKNEKQLRTIFSRTFSEMFYDKVASKLLKYFKITPENITRVNQYTSDDKGHSFVTIFFKSKKNVIPESDIKVFQREAGKLLKAKGYFGQVKSTKKQLDLLGNKKKDKKDKKNTLGRRAVEIPLVWKSKSLGGNYCLLFERFS